MIVSCSIRISDGQKFWDWEIKVVAYECTLYIKLCYTLNYDKHEIMLYITFCYTFDFVLFVFVKSDSKDIFLLFFSFLFLFLIFVFLCWCKCKCSWQTWFQFSQNSKIVLYKLNTRSRAILFLLAIYLPVYFSVSCFIFCFMFCNYLMLIKIYMN